MSGAAPLLGVDGIHAGYQSGIDILQDLSLSAPLCGDFWAFPAAGWGPGPGRASIA